MGFIADLRFYEKKEIIFHLPGFEPVTIKTIVQSPQWLCYSCSEVPHFYVKSRKTDTTTRFLQTSEKNHCESYLTILKLEAVNPSETLVPTYYLYVVMYRRIDIYIRIAVRTPNVAQREYHLGTRRETPD
jgi:hypothetical protein